MSVVQGRFFGVGACESLSFSRVFVTTAAILDQVQFAVGAASASCVYFSTSASKASTLRVVAVTGLPNLWIVEQAFFSSRFPCAGSNG